MASTSRDKLILLSDLWGVKKSEWWKYYLDELSPYFECTFYDSCELGGVVTEPYEQEHLHEQFVAFGIDKAAEKLKAICDEDVTVLAFSIGGTIAWRAGLLGAKITKLYSIAATRLRYETVLPDMPIQLRFAENDPFKPKDEWCQKMGLKPIITRDYGHNYYTFSEVSKEICSGLISEL